MIFLFRRVQGSLRIDLVKEAALRNRFRNTRKTAAWKN